MEPSAFSPSALQDPAAFHAALRRILAGANSPREVLEACCGLIAEAVPSAAISAWVLEENAIRFIASAGLPVAYSDHMPAASVPNMSTLAPESSIVEFGCPCAAARAQYPLAYSASVLLHGVTAGCLLLFMPDVLPVAQRSLIRDVVSVLYPALRWLPRSASEHAGHPVLPPQFVHDCRSQLSIILSAVECLTRYDSKWSAEKKAAYLARIVKAADTLRVELDRF